MVERGEHNLEDPDECPLDDEDIFDSSFAIKRAIEHGSSCKLKEVRSRHTCTREFVEEFNTVFVGFIKDVQKGIKMWPYHCSTVRMKKPSGSLLPIMRFVLAMMFGEGVRFRFIH